MLHCGTNLIFHGLIIKACLNSMMKMKEIIILIYVVQNNLSVRKLNDAIKEKSFDRLSYADKKNIKLIIENKKAYSIKDMILDPILINIKDSDKLNEKVLKKIYIKRVGTFLFTTGFWIFLCWQ